MEQLYIAPQRNFEKIAQAGKLGDAPELWPQEVLDLFYEQMPALADAEVSPVFKEINEERGYAVGALSVKQKPQVVPRDTDAKSVTKEIIFPIIVKDKEVSPFDVFFVGETPHPATDANVQAALFRPDLFDITKTMPGDVSLVNQLYPPYRSRYGFGTSFEGGAGGKFSSADLLKISMIVQVLPFMSAEDVAHLEAKLAEDPRFQKEALAHEPLRKTLAKLANFEPLSAEEMVDARRRSVRPDVVQFKKEGHVINVKYANSQMWSPQTDKLTAKEAAEVLPQDLRNRLAVQGSVTVSTEPVVRSSFDEEQAVHIKTSGAYLIKSSSQQRSGLEKLAQVYTNVTDFDGTSMSMNLTVFHDGDWSMQDKLAGFPKPDYEGEKFPSSGLAQVKDLDFEGIAKLGTVSFIGDGKAILPITIRSIRPTKDGLELYGTSSMEQKIALVLTDNIKGIEKLGKARYAIPSDSRFVHLGSLVKCSEDAAEYVKTASYEARLEIISDGRTYSFRHNDSLRKMAAGQTQFLSRSDALFLASAMGVESDFADRMLSQADRTGSVMLSGVRPIVTEYEKISAALTQLKPLAERLSEMRVLLLKEAAILPNEDTVDKVLSLSFITPENISIFTKNIPVFQATATELARTLIATRLGLEAVPEGAVQRAMQAIQGVIEAIQQLKYNQPSS